MEESFNDLVARMVDLTQEDLNNMFAGRKDPVSGKPYNLRSMVFRIAQTAHARGFEAGRATK